MNTAFSVRSHNISVSLSFSISLPLSMFLSISLKHSHTQTHTHKHTRTHCWFGTKKISNTFSNRLSTVYCYGGLCGLVAGCLPRDRKDAGSILTSGGGKFKKRIEFVIFLSYSLCVWRSDV
jgi:hypothetical protein